MIKNMAESYYNNNSKFKQSIRSNNIIPMWYDKTNRKWRIDIEQQTKDPGSVGKFKQQYTSADGGSEMAGVDSQSPNPVHGAMKDGQQPSTPNDITDSSPPLPDRIPTQQNTQLRATQAPENRYVQLMILLAAGEIDSCKWNAERMYRKKATELEEINFLGDKHMK